MADTLGNIAVPEPPASATPFPLVSQFPYGRAHAPQVVVHRFGAANRKLEQRFFIGDGLTRFTVLRSDLTDAEVTSLLTFWEACQGGYKTFTYAAPNDDQTTTDYTCRFADQELSFDRLVGAVSSVGITLAGVPTTSPTYTLNSTSTRLPSSGLQAALLAQAQRMIPLVKIQPKDTEYPAMYVSDRRCTVGAQLYQARLLRHDDISQSMGNEADMAAFVFGNADEVMTAIAADVDLFRGDLDFSLFHVGTGVKLDLWKGQVMDWEGEGQPEFVLRCSDALYELTLPYPDRVIGRRCWKIFNSPACPVTTEGTNAGVPCDKGFDTPNGCQFHSMDPYHGGIIAKPQSVYIKDNGTGFKGLGRNFITSTSLVEDSIYGTALPEIYTDIPMPVNCKLVAGREESDFYDALGIVGRGPLGAYGVGHTLDNQPHHGPGNLGLRESLGADPNPNPFNVTSTTGVAPPERAGGVAFIELRRRDEKGQQLSRLSEHSMKAVVAQGLSGWIWSAPGSRTTGVLVNPVWIAVNAHLRQMGLWYSSVAEQEKAFVVTSAIEASGICNDVVDKVIGEGTETQFKFRGRIDQQKSLRDWITDVLRNCLGYWVNDFGRLKIGIRFNSSAVEAFTESNILIDSLQLSPIAPTFNYIQAAYADEEFEFANNIVELTDDDHIALVGSQRQAQINLAGTSGKSQAARIITTLLREELGGVTAEERKKARRGSFKTTVLALNTEVGQVCSLTSPKMPGGVSGEFRIQRWTLHSDYSMTLEWRTTTDSMYDMVIGEKPVDVTASPETIEYAQAPERMIWHPNAEYPASGDPMFGADQGTFRLSQEYASLRDDNKQATLIIEGELPVNTFPVGVRPPKIGAAAVVTSGGSSLPVGDYFLALCATRADGQFSPPSNVVSVQVTATGKGIDLTDITWPDGTYTGWVLFAAIGDDRGMCAQFEHTGSLGDSFLWTGDFKRSTWTMPNPNFDRVRARGKRIWHDGVDGARITGVTSNTIVCHDLVGLGDDWSGRVVSVIADSSDGTAAIWNFTVSTYDHATGTFTVSPDPSAAGVEPDDVLIIRTKPTSAGSDWVEDTKWMNGHYPSGMTADGEVGRIIRIVAGKGAGQWRNIATNTSVRIFTDRAWDVIPDASSRFIVEASGWEYQADGPAIKTAIRSQVQIRVPCENMFDQAVLVCCTGVDRFAQESPEDTSAIRPIWMYGETPTVVDIDADYTVRVKDRVLRIDASGGPLTVTLLPAATMRGLDVLMERIDDVSANTVTIQAAPGETMLGGLSSIELAAVEEVEGEIVKATVRFTSAG